MISLHVIARSCQRYPGPYKELYRLSTCSYLSTRGGGTDPRRGEVYTNRAPVLIVGAGPVGLSLSILLSKYGIRSVVVEKRSKLSSHPQAHFINNRTMEIFRKMEGLADEIEKAQPPLDHWRRFVYCNTLAGPLIGTVDHLQPQDISREKSPTHVAHFSQHRLLPFLLNRAQAFSPAFDSENIVDSTSDTPAIGGVHFGHEVVSITTKSGGIVARLSSPEGRLTLPRSFECSYLVATDGAGSSVRNFLGVRMKGEEAMQKLISVHFTSQGLGQYLMKYQPGMLYFVFNARVIAVIVAHDLHVGEFVAQIPFYPPQQRFEDFTSEVCKDMIRHAAGIPNLAVEVKTTKQWVMHAQVAETFIGSDGRVFLVGDSAHRFPPAGGFGMNTGIQDAHNLAWKLAAVTKGWLPHEFLSTYDAERRPIAEANTALSVANFNAAMAIPKALGLNPSAASITQRIVNTGASWLPQSFQGAILDSVFAIGRLQVSDVFLSKYNPIASSRVHRVQQILQAGSSLQLQFPAEDLGFRYTCGALVLGNADSKEEECAQTMGRRREFVPSSSPGARLPHMPIFYLDAGFKISNKEVFSTLDLISGNHVELLLIVGLSSSGCKWGLSTLEAANKYGFPVKVSVIWPRGSARRYSSSKLTEEEQDAVHRWRQVDAARVVHVEEAVDSWWSLCGFSSSGALLVRPDDHIAWRATKQADNDATSEIERALKQVLRRTHDSRNSVGV